MERVAFYGYEVSVDVAATRAAYAALPVGDPERCGCLDCRNFVAARASAYPPEAVALLERLGIVAAKEAEVYLAAPEGDGRYRYEGWFHFVGAIERHPGGRRDAPLTEVGEFSFYLHEAAALVPPTFPGAPLVQLQFQTLAPWVLPEPWEEPGSPTTTA